MTDALKSAAWLEGEAGAGGTNWNRKISGAAAVIRAQHAEIDRLRAAIAAPQAAPSTTVGDVYTLIGYAIDLRDQGKTEMPAYFFDLAARIAPDAEHARRVREIAAAPTAPEPGERATPQAGEPNVAIKPRRQASA